MLIRLEFDEASSIATIWLNRPAKLNALSQEMLEELDQALQSVENKALNEVRLLFVKSSCERAFSVGADIRDWNRYNVSESYFASQYGTRVFGRLASLKIPTIAVLHKWVLGGGFELALACDLRLATEDTILGFPEASLGNAPGWAGLSRLVPLVGVSKAKEMVFTGQHYTADEAYQMGIINVVGDAETIQEEEKQLIQTITKNAPIPLMLSKRLIDEMANNTTLFSFIESLEAGLHAGTNDHRRGKDAYFNKSTPTFAGD